MNRSRFTILFLICYNTLFIGILVDKHQRLELSISGLTLLLHHVTDAI